MGFPTKVKVSHPTRLTFLFITLVLVTASCLAVYARSPLAAETLPEPALAVLAVLAPVNPHFVEFVQGAGPVTLQLQAGDEYPLGLIPSPLDLSHLKGQIAPRGHLQLGAPVSYDLRTQGKLTPVRNQGSCGSCWSFGTYSSLESNLMPAESLDFSENNLKNTHGFDWGPCSGGNADISTAYLARWSGPISESADPYNASSGTSPSGLSPVKHVQEVLFLPDRTGSLDNEILKQAVMSYGAIYTSMYWGSSYYNATTRAYYFSGSSSSNHAVAIVGWDDNYDRNRFPTVPPANGAFIIRNSWGTSWGESGYFYISYYDSNIGKTNYVFVNAEPTTNYSRIYQYDPLGWVVSMGYSNTTAWFANVFTAAANEQIAAVSFYAASNNSSYEVYVYTDVTSGPRTGTLASSKTGTIAWAGYHTISLDSSAPVTSGQKFSVVVRLTTPSYNYPIPLEYPYSNYSSQATAQAGQSYFSSNGTTWGDVTGSYANTNVCVKAFAVAAPSETVSTPSVLTGQTNGFTGASYVYTTDGSTSSSGDSVQYLFDWGDGTNSGWLAVGTKSVSKSWSSTGSYAVKAQARCATHTTVTSPPSSSLTVTIGCPTPGTPSSPSPANGAAGVTTNPTLIWSSCADASTYEVYFGTSSSPGLVASVSGTSTSFSSLNPGTTYYWRIVARNSCGGSTSGPVWSFTTVLQAPAVPALSSPLNGATGVSTSPTLSWSATSGATSYRLQVSTSSDFSSTVVDQSGITATSYGASGLLNNTTYSWRVNATNAGGTSAWSSVWNFMTATGCVAPASFAYLTPTNGVMNQPQHVDLDWGDSSGASSYDIYFGTANPPALVANVASSSYDPGALSLGSTYYWKVVAKNACGTSAGPVWSFTTASCPTPNIPSSPSPSNGAIKVGTAVTLTWGACAKADSYDVYFGTSRNPAFAANVQGTSYSPPGLNGATTYYWKVVAKSSCGASASGPVWSFRTVVKTKTKRTR